MGGELCESVYVCVVHACRTSTDRSTAGIIGIVAFMCVQRRSCSLLLRSSSRCVEESIVVVEESIVVVVVSCASAQRSVMRGDARIKLIPLLSSPRRFLFCTSSSVSFLHLVVL